MKNKLSYLILFFLIAVIALALLLILKKDNDTINLWASGNMNNSGCLSIYVNDQNNNEYSFDNGKTWQSSKYGAIYDKNIILVRDKEKNTIYQKELNYQFDNAPIIKIDFDKKINNKTNKEYLKDVSATYNNEDISSYIRVNVIKEDDDKVLVSYSVDDNDKSCFLLREINIEKSDTSENADKWIWPTIKPYRISRGLSKTHNGLDIFGPKRGSSIFAAFDGEVVDINSNSSSGYYVTIKHENGYYTRYAHLQNTDGNDKLNLTNSATKYIKVGQKVHAKEIIGEMGASGNSTGIHLHFEVWGGEPFKSKLYNPQIFY